MLKKITFFGMLVLMCVTVFAQSETLKQNETAFRGMTNVGLGLRTPNMPTKFNVCTEDGATGSADCAQMAVKIWFTDASGKPYNPIKHRFNPKERFDLWVVATCPVQISLFQNYPENRPESRLVYPVANRPESYQTLAPNVPVRVPVSFEMDDDMRNEEMSIVVAKAGLNVSAVQTAIENNQNVQVIANAGGSVNIEQTINNSTDIGTQTLVVRCMGGFQRAARRQNASNVRFQVCEGNVIPAANGPAQTFPQDTCLILFGQSNLAQYELTLHK